MTAVPVAAKLSLVKLNVREVLEKENVEDAKEISRKVNMEIEKKREELRMLVGERYRDLIDAADTIGTMRQSSVSVFDKLTLLRDKLNTLPTQLNTFKSPPQPRLNSEELEIAAELKLSLEAPRQIHVFLEKQDTTPAVHLSIFYEKTLCQSSKPYHWTFLANSGQSSVELSSSIKKSILDACDSSFDDFESPSERLAECLIAKQILTKSSCQKVIIEFLERQIKGIDKALVEKDSDFVNDIATTIQAVYFIFIDPQIYNTAAKAMKKPKLSLENFGLKFLPKSVEQFNRETITVEEPPRVTVLAEIIFKHFVEPLKQVLQKCYKLEIFMSEQKTFQELSEYRKKTTNALKDQTNELMRIVLGTSKTLWSETFEPVFLEKCQKVSSNWIQEVFKFLDQDAFPRFQKLDEQFDLVSFVWKAPALNEKSSPYLDVDLKLKCLSPHLAGICEELEVHLQEFIKDFQHLGDFSVKEYTSMVVVKALQKFVEDKNLHGSSLFLGRFCSALTELCPTLWKIVDKTEGLKLKQILASKCEICWTAWSDEVANLFTENLKSKMSDLSPFSITSFMPVAEEFIAEGDEVVKPSIRVPLQLSHALHSLVFGMCVDLARVGPQSIPKSVRENLRHSLGIKIQDVYEQLVDKSKENADELLIPQVAIQFIFDLKFCQWFHSKLSEVMEPTVSKLQAVIDPFDLDIVIPRLKINLKRFLFETHLTLGLLFSEESHSFIAQNFKTKQNQSFPIANSAISSPLPLLPV